MNRIVCAPPSLRRAAVALGLAALATPWLIGCSRERPPWARLPPGAIAGDPTVSGEPAPVGRLAAPPVIDGRLDEPGWATATALGPFVNPGQGEAAASDDPVFAFARVAWDGRALYLGVVVSDKDPVAPFATAEVDPHVWGKSSAIELMLQPGDPGDNRDYYEIQVDTGGAVFDSRWDDYNQPIIGAGDARMFGHQEWSSELRHAAHVERGRFYAIEAELPWSALGPARTAVPPRPGDVWRLDLYSFRDGQRRSLAWSPLRRQGNFHKSSRFGRVRFQP